MREEKNRIEWIDTMRGIAMIMVIYGHIDGGSYVGKFVYLFHVPAFFFLSGYLFNPSVSLGRYFQKRICRLLVPFVLFGSTVILINWACHIAVGSTYDALHYIKDMLLQVRGTDSRIWFLPCLFLAESIMMLAFRVKQRYLRVLVFTVIIFLGWFNVLVLQIDLPWYPDTAAIAASLMLIGHMTKRWNQKNLLVSPYALILSMVVCIGIYVINLQNEYGIDMVMNRYGNPILFYCGALSGIVLLMNVSNLGNNIILKYVGKNTITFLCLNTIAIRFVEKGLSMVATTDQLLILQESLVFPWVVTVLAVVVLIPASFIINKYIPLYAGNMGCQWGK